MTDIDPPEAGRRGARAAALHRRRAVLGDIRALLSAPAVTPQIAASGGTPSPAAPLDDYLARLDDFAARQ
ncbi:hypothetical protein [Micromonospora sp. 050-3]|uniref:hypothetical protein n=1 Tax=Micromonospora sp. 050-3 TaxID=2789265 RepID=UPI003977E81F